MALSGIVKKWKRSDGSLIQSEVLSGVKEDDVLTFLWSEIVGDELSKMKMKHCWKMFAGFL